MTRIAQLHRGTDSFDEATRGYVFAERINDVVAKPDSKRYQRYLRHVQDAFMGEEPVDPIDEYREKAIELLPRALEAYEIRDGVELVTGRVYFDDEFSLCAAPHAVEGADRQLIGITVHIRQRLKTYHDAVQYGLNAEMRRHGWAMMAVTGLTYWLHLDYFEDPEQKIRKLSKGHEMTRDSRVEQLHDDLRRFAAKTRFRAAEAVGA